MGVDQLHQLKILLKQGRTMRAAAPIRSIRPLDRPFGSSPSAADARPLTSLTIVHSLKTQAAVIRPVLAWRRHHDFCGKRGRRFWAYWLLERGGLRLEPGSRQSLALRSAFGLLSRQYTADRSLRPAARSRGYARHLQCVPFARQASQALRSTAMRILGGPKLLAATTNQPARAGRCAGFAGLQHTNARGHVCRRDRCW